MNVGVAVYFRCGSLDDFCLCSFGDSQDIDGAHDIGLDCFDGIELVVHRRCRAGQVVDFVHFQINGIGNVVPDQFKMGMPHQMGYVFFAPGEKVVQADNVVAFFQQPFAEMRTEKSRAASNQYSFHIILMLICVVFCPYFCY